MNSRPEIPPSGKGRLFIVSAPSGGGKSTICAAALKRCPDLSYSISTTTRPPRSGETHGVAYFFVDQDEFKEKIKQGHWAEWAKVHDHYYGTSVALLNAALAEGRDILLDIDVQGAGQIVKIYPDSVTIFIIPPSLDVLRARLQARQSDSLEVIEKRLVTAEKEMAQKDCYRHIVVNDDLDGAVEHFVRIIEQYRQ